MNYAIVWRTWIVCTMLLFSSLALADDVYWNNAAGGNWNAAGNWSTGNVPAAGDNVFITLDGSYTVTLDVNITVLSLQVGAASGTQTLAASGRTITLTNGGTVNGNGVLNLSASTINSAATLNNNGTINLLDNNNIAATLSNAGTVTVQRLGNQINGPLATTSSSVVELSITTFAHVGLTVANGFTNNGNIRFSNTYNNNNLNSSLTVSGGNLVNVPGATIEQVATYGNPSLNAALDNQGTFLLSGNRDLTLTSPGGGHVNTGAITVDAGRTLNVSNSNLELAAGGSVSGGGVAFSNATVTFSDPVIPAVPLSFTNSALAGSSTVQNNGTLEFFANNTISADLENNGTLRFQSTGNQISGDLTTTSNSVIEMSFTAFAHVNLTVASGFTNNGIIRFTNTYSNNNLNSSLTVSSGSLINAPGATIEHVATAGNHTLNAALNNQGSLILGGDRNLALTSPGGAHVNTGTITIAAGRELNVNNSSIQFAVGGSVSGGPLVFSSATANFTHPVMPSLPMRFTNSTLTGSGTVQNHSELDFYGNNIISANLENHGTLRFQSTGNQISGALTTTSNSVIEISFTAFAHVNLTVASGFTNNGIIRFTNTYSNNNLNSSLTVSSGSLVNAAGATIEQVATAGNPTLNAALDNQGTFLLSGNRDLTLTSPGGGHVNTGAITVDVGRNLNVSNSNMELAAGGSVSGGGVAFSNATITFSDPVIPAVPLSFTNSTLAGSSTVQNNGTLEFFANNTISADLENHGTLRFQSTGNQISGALTTTSNSVIEISFTAFAHVNLTVASGFTNNGIIRFTNTYSNNNLNSSLTVSSGSLINAPGATIEHVATAGNHTLNAALNNQGSLILGGDRNLALTSPGGAHVNTGTITIAAGRELNVNNSSIQFAAGGSVSGGPLVFSSATANFTHPVMPSLPMRFTNSTLTGSGTVQNHSELDFYGNNIISANLENHGTLRFQSTGNQISGALTTASNSVIELSFTAFAHVNLTVASGFTNNGIIRFTNTYSNNNLNSSLTVSSGSLINAPGATIEHVATAGNHTLNAALDNQGSFLVSGNRNLALTSPGGSHINTGAITIDSGRELAVNNGTIEFAAGGSVSGGPLVFTNTTANFSNPVMPSLPMRFTNSTLTGSGTVQNHSELDFYGNNIISANLENHGTLRFQSTGNQISGALTTASSSVIELSFTAFAHVNLTVANGFTNNGIIRFTNTYSNNNLNSSLTVSSGSLINAPGATIEHVATAGNHTLNAALNNQGLLRVSGNRNLGFGGVSLINAPGGVIEGDRALVLAIAALENQGTIAPGVAGKGALTVVGNLNQSAGGALNVELEGLSAGTEYDQLAVTNAAILDGTLNISLTNSYEPAIGDSFQVLTYGSRADTFMTVTGRDIGNGKYIYTHYWSDHLTLAVGPPPVTPTYIITASAGANGSISPVGEVEVFQGLDQTFTISPASGYQVADVLVDGVSVGTITSYTFSNVTADHTIEASFEVQTFTITASAGANGSISPSGNVTVNGGDDQLFDIIPDPGYHVLDVLIDGVSAGPLSGYVFTNVNQNHTIEATFEINTYTIVAVAGPNGSISPAGSIPVTHGSGQSFSITPAANYQIANVLVDGVSVGAVSSYTFDNVGSNHSISASFAPITHTITATAGSGGLMQPSGSINVAQGSSLTVNIYPNPGYEIDIVLVDGNPVGAVSSYTFDNITTSHTIEASFLQNSFTITASAGANGSIDPSGSIAVAGGASQTFNIIADPGYHVDEVLIDGVSAGPLTTYTFGNVAADHTIEAGFALNVYNILSVAGPGGTIAPAGTVPVDHGNDQNFSIIPDVDYSIGDVYVDGVSQGAISNYEFLNVTSGHSIAAYFTPDNFSYATLSTGVTFNIHATYFISATVGYAVGEAGTFLITLDGGQTWTASTINAGVDLNSVVVINDTIWVAGTNGHICYSPDGGVTWVPASPGGSQTFYSLTFLSGGYGFACGADGLIYYWNGTSWVQQLNLSGVTFYGIYAIGGYAYAVGSGGVVYFFNGTSWAPVSLNITVDLYGVYFLNASFGYLVGAGGTIYRTIDGGANWVALNTGVTVLIRNIIIGDANTAWAVCADGSILQTTDGGDTWVNVTVGCGCDLYGIAFAGGQGYIVGSGGVAYNFESTLVSGTPAFAVSPASIDFGNVGVGYARTRSVTVTNTGDAQLNLSAISSTSGDFIPNPLSASIPPAGSLEVSITFLPGSAGAKSGSIQFSHNAAGSPHSVAVSGNGVESGLTFTPVNIGTNAYLYGASFLTANYGAVVGAGGTVYITADGGQSWVPGNLGVTVDLHDIQFAGSAAFIVGANGHICRSTDGGFNWTPLASGTTANFYASHFINAFYGFAVGSGGTISIWDGNSWTVQATGVSNTFYSVYAIGNTAYAVGSGGIICRYINGVWVPQVSGVTFDFNAVVFLDENFGYAVGANGTICRTFDGGNTWVTLNSGVSLDITGIKIFNPQVAWATCADGLVLQTLDGGLTWTQVPVCGCGDFAAIDFNGCNGIVVGQDGQAYTFSSDQCTTQPNSLYTRMSTGTTQRLTGISFVDGQNGCIAGAGGTVLVTTNGGQSWVSSNTGVITDLTGIRLIGNAGFITGLNGLICVSYDGGLTWNPFNTNTSVHFYASAFTSASFGFAVGGGGTICVYNGGSWQPQVTNTNVTFYGVYALDNTAWAVGEGGTICRYINGVWTPQVTNTSITFYDVAFVNRNFGYAVGADGTICRTRDGGLTWIPLVSGVNVRLRAIKILSPRVAYCLGDDGVVLETTDCGDTWTRIDLDLPLELEALEIVDGQGFIAGELGEAYRFARAELSSYQRFSLSSDSLEVGIVSLGGDQSASITVNNDGPAPLDISSISSDNSDFTITPASGIIAPGGSQVFDVTFTPTVVGTAGAGISFSHDGDCEPSLLSVRASAIPASYSVLNTGVNVRLTGVSFIDALNGCVAGEGGTVLATSDGGQSWTSVGINPNIDLTGIKLVGGSAFLTGTNGHICRSDNGGQSWVPFTTNTSVTFHAASFLNVSHGWAVGGGGTICYYNGVNWVPQTTNLSITFYGVYAIGNTAYAVGAQGTVCKFVNGVWVPVNPGVSNTFYACAFVNENFGYIVGSGGIICRTRNGGLTWEPLVSGVTVDLKACKVVSPKVAYCVGEDGTVLKTEDCGETWTPVDIGLSLILEDIEIINGQGFIVGELGEAFKFSNPAISEFQLFSLSAGSVDFGEVDLGSAKTETVTINNTGTAPLAVSNIVSDETAFSISPNSSLTIAPGESTELTLTFTPAAAGAIESKFFFTHDAACELDSLIVSGSGVEPVTLCQIAGQVQVNGAGLADVTVQLLDENGLPLADYPDITTDGQGGYLFADVPQAAYKVMIVEPLGYASSGNPQELDLTAGCPGAVDFPLSEVVITSEARSMGYWKHQFNVYLTGRGHAQESEDDLYAYIDVIHQHYTPHFDVFAGMTSFEEWQAVLSVKNQAPMWERARQQLAAMVLNFASLKIGQYTVVTADGRTAGDVLTYVSQLMYDGDPSNDELAKDLAEDINLQREIGAGIVPAGSLLYKGGLGAIMWNFEGLPTEFALYQNYPNPFNPATTIRFDLPVAGRVSLAVYNILGQKVAELVNGHREAGRYSVNFDAGRLASGMYIYRIQAGNYSKVHKMLLIK